MAVTDNTVFAVVPAAGELQTPVAAVVASLPRSLSLSEDGQLSAISGGGDWCARATEAITAGQLGLVIDRPGKVDVKAVEDLAALAHREGASVVIRSRWAAHPGVEGLVPLWQSDENAVVIDCFASGDPGEARLLIDQLLLVVRLLGPIADLTCDHIDEDGYMLRARRIEGDVPVSIAWAYDSLAPRVDLRFLRRTQFDEVSIIETGEAQPLRAFKCNDAGESRLPEIYEGADRAAWRRVHRALSEQKANTEDLVQFASVLRLIGGGF